MGDTARNFIKIRSRGDAETAENTKLALKMSLPVFKLHVQTNELTVIQNQCKYFRRLFSVLSTPPPEAEVYDLTRIATSLYTQHHLF
jgi:hypothetical protein